MNMKDNPRSKQKTCVSLYTEGNYDEGGLTSAHNYQSMLYLWFAVPREFVQRLLESKGAGI